jgi:hypothetical protein
MLVLGSRGALRMTLPDDRPKRGQSNREADPPELWCGPCEFHSNPRRARQILLYVEPIILRCSFGRPGSEAQLRRIDPTATKWAEFSSV